MSQPHHALLFIMTALPWQCLLQTSLLAAVAAAESCLKVRGDGPRVYHSFLLERLGAHAIVPARSVGADKCAVGCMTTQAL